jgi:hypothetical protein
MLFLETAEIIKSKVDVCAELVRIMLLTQHYKIVFVSGEWEVYVLVANPTVRGGGSGSRYIAQLFPQPRR